MDWLHWVLWFSGGFSVFFVMTKFELSTSKGYNQTAICLWFLLCLMFWPLIGLYNAVVKE